MATTTNELQVLITAKDEASRVLRNIQGSAETLGKSFTVVGAALTGALALTIKSASDAQAQIARVDATLKTLGTTGLNARSAIIKAADATLKLGFDNEEAAVSITKFFQRTGDLTQAIKLNNLALDLARAKNIDLSTASTLVTQVLAGNGRILKQYGIDIKETASPLEALGILQDRVRGQAEAFGKTFQGQIAILNQQFAEVKEKIGGVLLPILTQLFQNYLLPIIEKIMEWTKTHPELFKQIVIVTGAVAILLTVLGPLLLLFSLLSPTVIGVGAVIALLGAGIFFLSTKWQELKNAIDPTLFVLKEMVAVISAFLEPAIDFLIFAIKELWNQLKILWDLLSPILIPTLQFLAFLFGSTLVGAIAILIASIGVIALIIVGFIQGIRNLINTLAELIIWFQDTVPASLRSLGSWFTNIWEGIKNTVSSVGGFVIDQLNAIVNTYNRVAGIVSQPFKTVGGAIKNTVATVAKAVGVRDAVITPQGQVIQTDPADFIFATRNPASLAGGGGITVNINGGTYLSERVALDIGDMIVNRLKNVSRITR